MASHALAGAAQRFASSLDPDADWSRPVPRLSWTVGDLVSHVVSETTSFAQLATGAITADALWARFAPGTEGRPANERTAALNAGQLAQFDRDQLRDAGALVEAAVGEFLDATSDLPPDHIVHSIEGDLDLVTLTCVLLGELLVHSLDLSRGLGRKHSVPAADARLVLAGVTTLLPEYLDPAAAGALRATLDLRIRGGSRTFIWVHDGVLEVGDAPAEHVDCHVSADPVAFLLVSYGRQSHWRAALSGDLVAWGRRPWIVLQLPALLRTP